MKTLSFFGFWLLFISRILSQEFFFYAEGSKVPLTISSEQLHIKLKTGITETGLKQITSDEPDIMQAKHYGSLASGRLYAVKLKQDNNIQDLVSRLRTNPAIERIFPSYRSASGVVAGTYDQFAAQLSSPVSKSEIESFCTANRVEIVRAEEFATGLYEFRLREDSGSDVLTIANRFSETFDCRWSMPDWILPYELHSIPTDTYFSNQYYLHNTGQTGGTADADIDAPEAWDITKGSSSIIVAVIDEGICTGQNPLYPVHEDLPLNRLDILPGSDIVGGEDRPDHNDPSPGGNENHGMACAGIIAASHNGIGIAGIAPNCKIMPIRVFDNKGYGMTPMVLANAVNFAWTRNADVINMSLGWNNVSPNEPYYIAVRNAVNDAMRLGRGGKGCVVVATSGNSSGGYVAFPANIDSVIAVGAIDKSNQRWWFSNIGATLDIVAPSGEIGYSIDIDCNGDVYNDLEQETQLGDVWSIDIPGEPGYNPGWYGDCETSLWYNQYVWTPPGGDATDVGNYTAKFSGTSAAAPQAAGVAALILSLNPQLTHRQVSAIINQSADNLGPAGFDNDYGWGRLNAFQALVKAATPVFTAPVIKNHWCYNTQKTITWSGAPNRSYTVKISTDGGITFPATIASNVTSATSTYSYNWTVNAGPSLTCKLLIVDNGSSAIRDTSDLFAIDDESVPFVPGSFNVISKSGHPWLTWTGNGIVAGYELYRASSESRPSYVWYKFKTIYDPTASGYVDIMVDIGVTNPNTMIYKMKAFNGCNITSDFTAEKSINYDQFMKTKRGDQEENILELPNDFSLKQNYPNPFNPTTTIEYAVPKTVLFA